MLLISFSNLTLHFFSCKAKISEYVSETIISSSPFRGTFGRPKINLITIDDRIEDAIEEIKNIQKNVCPHSGTQTTKKPLEDDFLTKEFGDLEIGKVPFTPELTAILKSRISEIENCIKYNIPLAAVILTGSTLEGTLFGLANNNLHAFNSAKSSPKDDTGTAKRFGEWTLNDLINVAYELGFIELDVKNHSQTLRDFRNYIHPNKQLQSKFNPTRDSAKISFQVLKAAISQISSKSK